MNLAESLDCSPETVATLLVSYTLIQNKTFLKGINKYKGIKNAGFDVKLLVLKVQLYHLLALDPWELLNQPLLLLHHI